MKTRQEAKGGHWPRPWLLFFGCIVACGPSKRDCPPVAQITQPIINGQAAASDAATVAIGDVDGQIYCSGVLISAAGRTFVATAAHCVDLSAYIFGGVDALAPQFVAKVSARTKDERYDSDQRYDLGLLSAPDIPPSWARLPLSDERGSLLGQNERIVGFGLTSLSGAPAHLRETITVTVNKSDDVNFQYAQDSGGPCSGDSGGPALDPKTGILVGLTSSGDIFCRSYGVSVRAWWLWDLIAPLDPGECPKVD
ncbi:MAG: trypsin-like serine protease [Polyangiaceae bacterium]